MVSFSHAGCLHYAANSTSIDMIKFFVTLGADVTLKNRCKILDLLYASSDHSLRCSKGESALGAWLAWQEFDPNSEERKFIEYMRSIGLDDWSA